MTTAQANTILTSIYGRRLGLKRFETAQSGAPRGVEFLVGQDFAGPQAEVTTNGTTAANEAPWGVSNLFGTSAASTPVYTLAPPIPGVFKVINFGSTDSAIYIKMAAGVSIQGTSLGATGATAIRSSGGGTIELVGMTTASYAAMNVSSSAVNGVGFQATT